MTEVSFTQVFKLVTPSVGFPTIFEAYFVDVLSINLSFTCFQIASNSDFGYKMLVSAKKVMSKSKEKLHFTYNFNTPEWYSPLLNWAEKCRQKSALNFSEVNSISCSDFTTALSYLAGVNVTGFRSKKRWHEC